MLSEMIPAASLEDISEFPVNPPWSLLKIKLLTARKGLTPKATKAIFQLNTAANPIDRNNPNVVSIYVPNPSVEAPFKA